MSELVTNAIDYAPRGPVFVTLPPSTGKLLIEVWDLSPEPPVLREPDVLHTEGRGLHVVKELSLSYGFDLRGRWKVVWAILDGR